MGSWFMRNIVPRTWFNIGNHNNKYSITYEETKIIEKDYAEYDIGVKIEQGTADADVIEEINQTNKKVKIHIADTSAVTFQDGLKDLLGLKQSTLHGGTHISDYQLELDGGSQKFYVYTDIIESHLWGYYRTFTSHHSVMSTKEDQNVINYQRPLYFPLRQNYIDCIEVELKSILEMVLILRGGKSLLVLSFDEE
ncbi:uncharacterized protein TNCT_718311 [Trichonephila clavata]|uniref:Uncharacterized protein n=1 Tax=Trichonephila clavata TaxID=2740835 RepID=A0A8X6F3T3_TRICU|nr:uncharacterized protein TNCT_718311 [Trichonephila clavata]